MSWSFGTVSSPEKMTTSSKILLNYRHQITPWQNVMIRWTFRLSYGMVNGEAEDWAFNHWEARYLNIHNLEGALHLVALLRITLRWCHWHACAQIIFFIKILTFKCWTIVTAILAFILIFSILLSCMTILKIQRKSLHKFGSHFHCYIEVHEEV